MNSKGAPEIATANRTLFLILLSVVVAMGAFVLCFMAVMAPQRGSWAKMQAFNAQANALFQADEWDKVLTLSQAQQKNFPSDANAVWVAGKAHFYKGQHEKAIADWQTAIRMEPSWNKGAQPWFAKAQGGISVRKQGLPQPIETIASEEKERRALRNEAQQLLTKGDYAALEKRAATLRAAKAVFPDGRSKLRTFYDGLAYLPGEKLLPSMTLAANNQEAEKLFAKRQSRLNNLEKWSAARSQSVTAQTALAYAYLVAAWKARTGGYASQISKEQLAAMQGHLQQASAILEKSSSLRAQCPVWFTTAQQVAILQGWSRADCDAVFAVAVQNYPEHQEIYFQRLKYLMPRWHGRSGEWENEAESMADAIAAATKSPDEGDIFYARAVTFLREVQPKIFQETSASWPRVQSGFQTLKKRHPDSLEVSAKFAFLAGEAEDFSLVQSLYQNSIKGRYSAHLWNSKSSFIDHRCWAFGPH